MDFDNDLVEHASQIDSDSDISVPPGEAMGTISALSVRRHQKTQNKQF